MSLPRHAGDKRPDTMYTKPRLMEPPMKQLKTACSKAAACVRGYLVERAKRITMEQELTMNRKYGWMRKDTVIAKSLVQPM